MTLFYRQWRAMNCDVSVQLETDDDGYRLLDELPADVETIEATLSRFRPLSELMQLNARAGEWVVVSQILFDNLLAAKQAARLTDGRFNPLILPAIRAAGYDRNFAEIEHPLPEPPAPAADWHRLELRPVSREVCLPSGSGVDLGGIAKGWAAAWLANRLATHGPCLVNLGGDIVARGAPHGYPGWEVQVQDPFSLQPLVTLWLRNASLVTSGIDFRRWTGADGTARHHIIDPRTGASATTDVWSVTVYHPHAPTAEAYAKAVLLRGAEAGLNWLQSRWDAAGLVIRHDGSVLATPTFADSIVERISL